MRKPRAGTVRVSTALSVNVIPSHVTSRREATATRLADGRRAARTCLELVSPVLLLLQLTTMPRRCPFILHSRRRRRRRHQHCRHRCARTHPTNMLLAFACISWNDVVINPLMGTGNYTATPNNMKLVHWPLIGGLLHLAQRWGDWATPQPTRASPRCTKCKSRPINDHCRIAI